MAACKGDKQQVPAFIAARYPKSALPDLLTRAAIAPGATTDAGFGSALAPLRGLGSAFLELLRPRSVVGQMEAGFTRVSFNAKFARETAGANLGWVGEGAVASFSRLSLDLESFEFSKLTSLIAISNELARFGDPDSERTIEQALSRSIIATQDSQFLDPSVAEIAGVGPASITNGIPAIAASGATLAAFRTDARQAVQAIQANGGTLEEPYWILSPIQLTALALLDATVVDADAQCIAGIPYLTTTISALRNGDSPDSQRIVLIDAAQVLWADGGLELDTSRQATVMLDTGPDSPETASSVPTSLWQRGMTGIRAIRYCRWEPRSAGVGAMITGASYGF